MKKIYVLYPLAVLVCLALVLTVVVLSLQKIGSERLYRDSPINLEGLTKLNVWRGTQENTWMVSTLGPKGISQSDLKPVPKASYLDDFQMPSKSVLLILRFDADKVALKKMLRKLAQFELNQILIASPRDSTLRNLKSLEPRFYYAASMKTLMKWSLYSRLLIESVFEPEVDFIYLDEENKKLINPRIEKEIKKRRLPIIKSSEGE